MTTVVLILVGATASVVALIIWRFVAQARQFGSEQEQRRQLEKDLERANEFASKKNEVDALSDSVARERLRKWSRRR